MLDARMPWGGWIVRVWRGNIMSDHPSMICYPFRMTEMKRHWLEQTMKYNERGVCVWYRMCSLRAPGNRIGFCEGCMMSDSIQLTNFMG